MVTSGVTSASGLSQVTDNGSATSPTPLTFNCSAQVAAAYESIVTVVQNSGALTVQTAYADPSGNQSYQDFFDTASGGCTTSDPTTPWDSLLAVPFNQGSSGAPAQYIKFSAVVPYSDVGLASFTLPVDDQSVISTAPDCQSASSCTVNWSSSGKYTFTKQCDGTITYGSGSVSGSCGSVPCDGLVGGTVTQSFGAAPAVGTKICVGDSITTGKGTAIVMAADGSMLHVGPNSEIDLSGTPVEQGPSIYELVGGTIWSALPGGGVEQIDTSHSMGAVHGCAMTATVLPDKTAIYHFIQGQGSVTDKLTGQRVNVAPGYTATVTAHGVTIGTAWPAAARSLVPAAQAPPSISTVSVHGAKIRFKLSESAAVTLSVTHGERVVLKMTLTGRSGANSATLNIKHLRRGTDQLTVTAAVSGGSDPDKLTAVAQTTVRVG
jgi:hypothetical protein